MSNYTAFQSFDQHSGNLSSFTLSLLPFRFLRSTGNLSTRRSATNKPSAFSKKPKAQSTWSLLQATMTIQTLRQQPSKHPAQQLKLNEMLAPSGLIGVRCDILFLVTKIKV
jgi:hypothetical protein